MKFLLDSSQACIQDRACELVAGQLLTPLTNYANWGGVFAIDNGGYTGFDSAKFKQVLTKSKPHSDKCLFVAMPDVVGNARRTAEIFRYRYDLGWVVSGYKTALVAQDGLEDLDIDWRSVDAIFIGGGDPWKDSNSSLDIVRAAKIMEKHVHVGRVNTPRRFVRFHDIGADTCDGSGVVRYSHMLDAIKRELLGAESRETLFTGTTHSLEADQMTPTKKVVAEESQS